MLLHLFPALRECGLTVDAMDLEISVRNALKRGGVHTLAQLLQLSHPELLRIFPNRKLRSYEDVICCLVCLAEESKGMGADTPGFTFVEDISDTLKDAKISDKNFNIFQVAGVWKAEEIHTSVIAELINPHSAFHDKGADFLGKFLREIGVNLSPEEIKGATVKTEVPTDKSRRMDMVISTESCYLPFEVKIWAGDQDAQLQGYYAFSKAQAEKQGQTVPAVYYLTPDGHKPSERSCRGLSDDQICRLSFRGDILPWLDDCMNAPDVPADVLVIAKQLYDNIRGRPDTQNRPGGKGFSRWKREEDALDAIYQRLSREYDLPWTECTADYETFTLNKKEFEKTSLEFALRIKKERADQVRLYLICGLTRESGKPDYAIAGDYISKNAEKFNELLAATFKESGQTLGLKTSTIKSAWNRLPEKACYEKLDAEQCCHAVENIFKELLPGPAQALKKFDFSPLAKQMMLEPFIPIFAAGARIA